MVPGGTQFCTLFSTTGVSILSPWYQPPPWTIRITGALYAPPAGM